MDADEVVLETLRSALTDEVPRRVLDRLVLHDGPRCRRSKIYFVGCDGATPHYRWVVKQPVVDRRQEDLNSPRSAAAQFEAMQRLHAHLEHSDSGIRAPRPTVLMPEIGAFAMEYVDGPSVRDMASVRATRRPHDLIRAVVAAARVLRAVHSIEPAQSELVFLRDLEQDARDRAPDLLRRARVAVRDDWFSTWTPPSRTVPSEKVVLHGDFVPENVLLSPSGIYCIDADLAEKGLAERDVARFVMMLFEPRVFVVGNDVPSVRRLRRRAAAAFLSAYYEGRDWPETLRPLILLGLAARCHTGAEQLAEFTPKLMRARKMVLDRYSKKLLDEVSRPDWLGELSRSNLVPSSRRHAISGRLGE